MARHVCPNCGATVTGDEQFCPTCGTFLEYEEELPAEDDYETFDLGAGPPPASPVICPSCGAENSPGNRHCEECGARISQGPLPAAPRPAVQATAGVRAVIAIGGLLLGVIIIALLFQVFGGDEESPQTTPLAGETTTTTSPVAQPEVLDLLDVTCSHDGVGEFVCDNLTAGPDTLYQVNWEELDANGETLTITLRFRSAVAISRIDWTNITNDDTRFQRNYKARALTITSDDSLSDAQIDLQNIPGTQQVEYTSLSTHQLIIEVNSAWPAQLIDEQVFEEMAIDEIEVIGRPATDTGATTTTATPGDEADTTTTTEG